MCRNVKEIIMVLSLYCPRKARDKERGVNELQSNSRSRKRAF